MAKQRRRDPGPWDRFMLWVDAVGGFLVCSADEVTLGQPVRCETCDVPILADIYSRHARIRRDGEGYLIEAIGEVRVDRPKEITARILCALRSHYDLNDIVDLRALEIAGHKVEDHLEAAAHRNPEVTPA